METPSFEIGKQITKVFSDLTDKTSLFIIVSIGAFYIISLLCFFICWCISRKNDMKQNKSKVDKYDCEKCSQNELLCRSLQKACRSLERATNNLKKNEAYNESAQNEQFLKSKIDNPKEKRVFFAERPSNLKISRKYSEVQRNLSDINLDKSEMLYSPLTVKSTSDEDVEELELILLSSNLKR